MPPATGRQIWTGSTLLQAFLTIVEVILVCSFGALLAHIGIITQPVRQAMSKIGFYLLLPAITFVKVAEAVDATILREWWPLAANLCFSIFLGAALGYAGSFAVKTPSHLRRTVVVASSIGNINTIPLLVVASLCQSDDLMFNEVLGNTCSTKGIAYVAVGMAIGSVFHHSIAFHMLKPPKGHQHECGAIAGTPATAGRRSGAGGGGGGGGGNNNALGRAPSDATAIVVHNPGAAALAPAECKHCGAPCFEEEDAETGGRRVSYAPTLATTVDGGFDGGDGDYGFDVDENGNEISRGDRRSTVSSWLSDDMFCGLETLSEAVHFLHTPHSTASGLHHGLHWGNRNNNNGGGNRPPTPAPFARSGSNAAALAAAVRRSRHSAPETVGDEIKSPKGGKGGGGGGGGGGAGSRGASMPGDASAKGCDDEKGNNTNRPVGGSLESTLTNASMARAASSHVPGSLASAAAAAAAAGLHPSVFEHPSRVAAAEAAEAAAAAANAANAPAPPPPSSTRPPNVVMLSADAASPRTQQQQQQQQQQQEQSPAAVDDVVDPAAFVPFGGRLAAITTTTTTSHDHEAAMPSNNNNNNGTNGGLVQRRRSMSTSGSGSLSTASSSSLGDVPVGRGGGGGGGGGNGGGKKSSNNQNNNNALAVAAPPPSQTFIKRALSSIWNFSAPLRALLWFVLRPLFVALAFVEKMLPVPAIISLAGIGVGCCPPLKRLLFGAHAPLEFVAHSLHTVAGATVPVMSFILGAVLYRGPGKAKVPKRVLWGVIVVRLVAVPVIGGVVIIMAERAGWFRPVDPLFMFTLLLQGIAPTAINMQAIATMFRFNEAEMGALIFWQHLAYLFILPLYICGCMYWMDKLPINWREGGVLNKIVGGSNDPGLTP